MAVEVQRCSDCGWSESGKQNVNANRKKCPNCGAHHYETHGVQWFGGHGPGGPE